MPQRHRGYREPGGPEQQQENKNPSLKTPKKEIRHEKDFGLDR